MKTADLEDEYHQILLGENYDIDFVFRVDDDTRQYGSVEVYNNATEKILYTTKDVALCELLLLLVRQP